MDQKLQRDISWNMVSFIIIGISGIIINILIGKFYGASSLGVFNLIFSVYILLSQFAVFGIHQSALKYLAHTHNDHKISIIVYSSLIVTAAIAFLITILSVNLSWILGYVFSNKNIEDSWIYLAIGLFFFAMNKTLLSIINGLRHMRFFAASQALRYILAIAILIYFVIAKITAKKLGLIISFSEIILFALLIGYVIKTVDLISINRLKSWTKKHLLFGWHSLLGGIMGEINTRVDVLVLGVFVSATQIGIYTIALMIFEGFVQLTVVFRNNINPLLSKMLHQKRFNNLQTMIAIQRKKVYILLSILIFVSIIFYPLCIDIFLGDGYASSIILYYILISGLLLSAGYLPFNMILSQAGHPWEQSIYSTSLVVGNILLNVLLIPIFGMIGAAIATTTIYILNIFILKYLVRKNIGIAI